MTSLSLLLAAAVLAGATTPETPLEAGRSVTASGSQTNSVIEQEYQKLQEHDDAAQAEVDKWTRENADAAANGGGRLSEAEMEKRIRNRLEPVRKEYEDFLQHHPGHAQAHLTYGCFLNDRQDEAGAQAHWEKALELDPTNPDVYNNLAGVYSEIGPLKKAFDFYSRAIELNPRKALYYHNFASSMYVLRKKAMTHLAIDEQQVFARIIGLYSNAVRLEPTNYAYGTDLAQTYYSMRPFAPEPALNAWSNTLQSARNPSDRGDVYLHLARVQMLAGRFAEARALLTLIPGSENSVGKSNLLHNIELREHPEKPTQKAP